MLKKLARVLGPGLAYLWLGPRNLPRSLKLDWRLVAVRWVGIFFVTPGLLLMDLSTQHRVAAYLVILFAVCYNLTVHRMIRRQVAVSTIGFVTTVADSILNLAMLISISNGFDSPFAYFLFSMIVSVAMRYGYGPAVMMTAIFAGSDALDGALTQTPLGSTFVFFVGFLFITAILASYLREEARQAETALQERLRQASLLNEATAALGASLDLESVLQAVTSAAAYLFSSERAVLQPSATLSDVEAAPAPAWFPASPSAQSDGRLLALCSEYATLPSGPGPGCYDSAALPAGESALILRFNLPTRQITMATMALVLPASQKQMAPATDVIESFVDRAALALENAYLYRSLAGRSDDLQRAYSDLADAHQELLSVDGMKTNFLANVSHELRTPLTSIRSFSELLLSYDDPSVRQEFLEIIRSESERLTRLVSDVLDVTKIESGYMDWHMVLVDLPAFLHESVRVFEPMITKRQLTFSQDIEANLPPICADHDRLQQVVANLLNNALKFTPQGAIHLQARQVDQEVWISVTDTGIGIRSDDQERIFEKFQQVGAMLTDKPQGTGLGLAICRDIVAHHKGRLWVQSQPGEGSVFTFAVPTVAVAGPPFALSAVA
ncbi:MAG TPA: HAMP domain-containing sensor histidine kinase [Chloroflexota bacterium]|nr:HAMP domain-containing sensor histidine kinase [Chloroflexota bacterium]